MDKNACADACIDSLFCFSAVFLSNNLLFVAVELDGSENCALDLVPLVSVFGILSVYELAVSVSLAQLHDSYLYLRDFLF